VPGVNHKEQQRLTASSHNKITQSPTLPIIHPLSSAAGTSLYCLLLGSSRINTTPAAAAAAAAAQHLLCKAIRQTT
jgi:hypothetical protein